MAPPQRPQRQPDTASAQTHQVFYDEWSGDEDEETGPWCVDYGQAIEVLRTSEIHQRLEAGQLGPEVKVWRDGRACWLPLSECYELTVTPPPVVLPTPMPTAVQGVADEGPVRRTRTLSGAFGIRRLGAIVLAAFVVGLGFGALVYLPDGAASGVSAPPTRVERVFDPVRRLNRGTWARNSGAALASRVR